MPFRKSKRANTQHLTPLPQFERSLLRRKCVGREGCMDACTDETGWVQFYKAQQ